MVFRLQLARYYLLCRFSSYHFSTFVSLLLLNPTFCDLVCKEQVQFVAMGNSLRIILSKGNIVHLLKYLTRLQTRLRSKRVLWDSVPFPLQWWLKITDWRPTLTRLFTLTFGLLDREHTPTRLTTILCLPGIHLMRCRTVRRPKRSDIYSTCIDL